MYANCSTVQLYCRSMQWDVMPGHSRLIDNSGALKARRRPCQRRRRPRNRVAAKSSSAVTCLPRPFSSHAATVWAPAPTTDNIARSSTLRLSHIHTRNQSRSKWRVEIPRPMRTRRSRRSSQDSCRFRNEPELELIGVRQICSNSCISATFGSLACKCS